MNSLIVLSVCLGLTSAIHDGVFMHGGTCQLSQLYVPWNVDQKVDTDLISYRASAAATLGGRIFVTGGTSWSGLHFPTNYNQIMDTFNGDVKEGAPLRFRRAQHTLVVWQNRLLACGGSGSEGFLLNSCEVYSPYDDVWISGPDLPHHLTGHGSVVLNDRLYVFGGEGHSGPSAATYYMYSYDKHFSVSSPMRKARHNFAAAAYEGHIVACGGIVNSMTDASCEIMNPVSTGWALYTPMLGGRSHHVMANFGNTLYILGGFDEDATPMYSIEYYQDYANSSFIMYQNMTAPCAEMIALSLPV